METKRAETLEDVLYPARKPFNTGLLDVGDGHKVYYQEYGNPKGVPVTVVHGGPGAGVPESSRITRLHDPSCFRIICIDQRGCGQSTPNVTKDRKAALYRNTPDKLVEDMEKIRVLLKISKWHVTGYSWGSCLGALYASRHPEVCLSLIIGGIWMHTPEEIDWYFNQMDLFIPEAAEALLKVLPKNIDRRNRMPYIYKAITGKDNRLALKVAEAQGLFESYATCFDTASDSGFTQKLTPAQKKVYDTQQISLGALECYFMYKSPLPEGWYATDKVQAAFKSIKRFEIVQARYDIVCPPLMAYELHKLYPHSNLTMVQFAGHTFREPEITKQFMRVCDGLKY